MDASHTTLKAGAFVSAGRYRRTWAEYYRDYEKALRRCQSKPGVRGVHAVRIASRRLLALLAVLDEFHPGAGSEAKVVLQKVLRKSGRLRDAQVEVRMFEVLPGGPAPAARILRRLKKRARQRAKELARSFCRGLGRHLQAKRLLEANPPPSDARFQARVARMFGRSRAACRRQLQNVEAVGRRRQHHARLVLKAHRYLAEALLLPRFRNAEVVPLRAAQAALGAQRDLERLLKRLRKWKMDDPAFSRLARIHAPGLGMQEIRQTLSGDERPLGR